MTQGYGQQERGLGGSHYWDVGYLSGGMKTGVGHARYDDRIKAFLLRRFDLLQQPWDGHSSIVDRLNSLWTFGRRGRDVDFSARTG